MEDGRGDYVHTHVRTPTPRPSASVSLRRATQSSSQRPPHPTEWVEGRLRRAGLGSSLSGAPCKATDYLHSVTPEHFRCCSLLLSNFRRNCVTAKSVSILGLQQDSKVFRTGHLHPPPYRLTDALILRHMVALFTLEKLVLGCYYPSTLVRMRYQSCSQEAG